MEPFGGGRGRRAVFVAVAAVVFEAALVIGIVALRREWSLWALRCSRQYLWRKRLWS